jgi:hypothetical protein
LQSFGRFEQAWRFSLFFIFIFVMTPNFALQRVSATLTRLALIPLAVVAPANNASTKFIRSRRDRKRVEMLFAHLKRIFGWVVCVCVAHRNREPPQARKARRPTAAGHLRRALH